MALVLFLPAVAMACSANEETVFRCVTTNGKPVHVCQAKDTVNYRFGSKPDMEVKVPNAELKWEAGNGTGAFFNLLTFPHGKTLYQVLYIESFKGPPRRDGEVQVARNGKQLADIQCADGSVSFNSGALKTHKPDSSY
ncbi:MULTISPECIES: hypothetical protein [Rhodanobacter]|uniref:hypothetical protein n=1 Tax=Rhodanobacter TaxID=75309 RepID=UPI001113B93B|nr:MULTISPECIES: hypothetical protein [Rhodanobacter]